MRAFLSVIAALSTVAIATPSNACRAWRSPEQKIASGNAAGAISSIVVVTIDEAHYTGSPDGDVHVWTAVATINRLMRGSYVAKTVSLTRGFGSAACDEGYALPKPGDRWVVYFSKRSPADQAVWNTFPLEIAAVSDPSLLDLRL